MISIDVAGLDRLVTAMQGLREFRRNVRTKLPGVVLRFHKQQVRDRLLRTKSDPDGVAWAPWAPSTRAHRQRKGTASRGLLVDEKRLVNSFRMATSAGKGQLGTDTRYAGFLHYGTRRMPAREFLGVGRTDVPGLQALINAWVEDQLDT